MTRLGLTASRTRPERDDSEPDEAARAAVPVRVVRGQRRPWLIWLGVLMAVIGSLTVVWLVGRAGQRSEVLALRRDVAYGEPLTADDLTIARISTDPGLDVVAATQMDQVVGMVAATQLVRGSLLAHGAVAASGAPGPGLVLVPVALPSERLPAGGLRAGDPILVVDTSEATSLDARPAEPARATVVRVGEPDINGVSVIDVTTGSDRGAALAAAAANKQVAMVVLPAGG